ncbi:hypothetical protein PMIN06_012741 [Paraphaeosphaeria minitans]|uniref:Vegetative cell wall protein gp1 n=1 Tax=Paraphaeosphaeria minitans TaxID=565426 RepID=A0A9P6GSH1_9PLEO|nr:vegetative cell wall protein gp1 [Paraphaeosphaeria minitans]
MNFAPQYPTPSPGYMNYDGYPHRQTPPMSPGSGYYSPRYGTQGASPSPHASPKVQGHSRRASHAVPPQYNAYTSPRGANTPQYMSPRYYQTPQRTPEYVSGYFGYAPKGRQRRDTDATPLKRSHREKARRPSLSARHVQPKDVHDDFDPAREREPPPPYTRHAPYGYADQNARHQVPIYDPEPKASRPRRASHISRPQPQPQPTANTSAKRPAPPTKTAEKATEADARRAGIPAGYSYKNWDPTEEPIMLLGSVFDANSLGKWIYDWTVFHYGPTSPLAEMAGDLWVLLIQLAGKVKRAEEIMPKIRKKENHEMVEDFLESGERLWIRFAKLLKVCEDYMWKAVKKETGEKKPLTMGKNSGCEFVDSIFGRDRELEKTEKLMTGMRLWSMRFDANCEDILRRPTA